MKETVMVSELDLKIIHALQIHPRVDWGKLSTVLDVSAPTLARRWDAMTESGIAWVTPFPGPHYHDAGWSAFLYLSSKPDQQEELLDHLCQNPAFATVSLVSGPYDVLVDCYVSSYAAMLKILTESFANLPGLARREVVFTTEYFRTAVEWRSGTLEPGQMRRLEASVGLAHRRPVPDAVDARLIEELSIDGRAPWAQLGTTCGVSAQTAKRRVERLLASGYLTLRCDTATEVVAGQREITLLLSASASEVDTIGGYLASLPNCRVSAQILGAANILATLWVHDFGEVKELELELARRAPNCTVTSRQATVRHYKRAGRLLDSQGRSRGRVPVPLWGEQSPQ